MTHPSFTALGLQVARAALPLLLVCSDAQAANPQNGQRLYVSHCAICHGLTGRSTVAGAPNFDRGEGMLRSDASLLSAIRSGRNANPAFQGLLKDQEILDVIAYLRTLH